MNKFVMNFNPTFRRKNRIFTCCHVGFLFSSKQVADIFIQGGDDDDEDD